MLGMGVFLGQSTKIYDRATGETIVRPRAGRLGRRRRQPAGGGRQPQPVLRGHRQAGRREDAREDRDQRVAARVTRAWRSQLKSREDIAGMRVAGRLASELLDYLTPHVQPGVTTERDRHARARLHGRRAAHDSRDAQLRAAGPPALSGVDVHVGEPRRVPRHPGRQEAQGRRHRQRRRHRHQGRLPRRHEPHVLRRRAVDPGEAPVRRHLRGDVARHRRGASRARISATSAT